jgi:hypothetical protein
MLRFSTWKLVSMKFAHFVNNQQFRGEKGFQNEKGLESKLI